MDRLLVICSVKEIGKKEGEIWLIVEEGVSVVGGVGNGLEVLRSHVSCDTKKDIFLPNIYFVMTSTQQGHL
jgi:hypothetical protein